MDLDIVARVLSCIARIIAVFGITLVVYNVLLALVGALLATLVSFITLVIAEHSIGDRVESAAKTGVYRIASFIAAKTAKVQQ